MVPGERPFRIGQCYYRSLISNDLTEINLPKNSFVKNPKNYLNILCLPISFYCSYEYRSVSTVFPDQAVQMDIAARFRSCFSMALRTRFHGCSSCDRPPLAEECHSTGQNGQKS